MLGPGEWREKENVGGDKIPFYTPPTASPSCPDQGDLENME